MFSLRYCKDIANLLFFVLWAYLATKTQKDSISFQKTFVFICRQKASFIPPRFSGDTAKILELLILGAFGVPSHEHPNIDAISLYKTSMYNCMPKINLLIHFFLGILHFKESCNLISP